MKKETGITLVSLVVTIIILIILAGIGINTLVGDNGIITKAQQAKENMILAQGEEEKQLNELYSQLNYVGVDIGGGETGAGDSQLVKLIKEAEPNVTIKDLLDSEGMFSKVLQTSGGEKYVLDNMQNLKTDILESENALKCCFQNMNITNTLVKNMPTWQNDILNSYVAMKYFGKNEKSLNIILASNDWKQKILSTETARNGLDDSNPILVPAMTSNTVPKGEVIASGSYGGREAYYVFNGDPSIGHWDPTSGATSFYIGYKFEEANWLYKTVCTFFCNSNNVCTITYTLQASNDNSTWVSISNTNSINVKNGRAQVEIIPNSTNEYKYYRINASSSIPINVQGAYEGGMYKMQFYAK